MHTSFRVAGFGIDHRFGCRLAKVHRLADLFQDFASQLVATRSLLNGHDDLATRRADAERRPAADTADCRRHLFLHYLGGKKTTSEVTASIRANRVTALNAHAYERNRVIGEGRGVYWLVGRFLVDADEFRLSSTRPMLWLSFVDPAIALLGSVSERRPSA